MIQKVPDTTIPFIISDPFEWGSLYAEIVPAGSPWRPWKGRRSRWWYEIARWDDGGIPWTLAYEPGGSGGGFTLKQCIERATAALDSFLAKPLEDPLTGRDEDTD